MAAYRAMGPANMSSRTGQVGGAELLEHQRHQHQRREGRGEDAEVGPEPRIDEPGARGEGHDGSDVLVRPVPVIDGVLAVDEPATVTKAMTSSPWQARK